MPTIEILNGLLREVSEKIKASDTTIVRQRAEIERCSHGQAAAQEKLDQVLKHDEQIRRDHLEWMNYLNTLSDQGSPSMRQKLTDMTSEISRCAIQIRDHREMVNQWNNARTSAQLQLSGGEQGHKSLQEEYARITEEIRKA